MKKVQDHMHYLQLKLNIKLGIKNNFISTVINSGKLNIIDLAGSENMKLSEVEGERQKETQTINKSLFALGFLLSTLSNGELPTVLNYLFRHNLIHIEDLN